MTFSISSSYTQLRAQVDSTSNSPLPALSSIESAIKSLPTSLPAQGRGEAAVQTHLLTDLTPGFNGPKTSANYYGFVTGGVLPIAEVADNIVTAYDQSPMVHLPDQSVSTIVEDRALSMLVELLDLGEGWKGKTFTTGATGANVLGLACGREVMIGRRLKARGVEAVVGELGLLTACARAGVRDIQVLSTMGHSSLYKAASIVGLGRASVKDIPFNADQPWRLNIDLLERELQRENNGVVSIVAISAGEVNTGRFATNDLHEMQRIRDLCDKYGAWLHVDGAFGIFARCLPPGEEFAGLIDSVAGLELADSITGDGHKMLNVPYDCGFFLSRSIDILTRTFQNPNAVYLATGISDIPSPLNIGLENSRRFRALPVYAVLMACGRHGLSDVFVRQVRLARKVAAFLDASEGYELLPRDESKNDAIHIIVIFRAKDDTINKDLVKRINDTRKMYVSGTKWDGKHACRIAVSTWKVDVERDLKLIREVLEEVLVQRG